MSTPTAVLVSSASSATSLFAICSCMIRIEMRLVWSLLPATLADIFGFRGAAIAINMWQIVINVQVRTP